MSLPLRSTLPPITSSALLALACALTPEAPAQIFHWDVGAGGNGHYYQPVSLATTLTWDEANAAAQLAGGYLATLTSQAENDFVYALVDAPQYWLEAYLFWLPDPVTNLHGPYLGGVQSPGSPEPGGGWEWLNGDGLFVDTFENWAPGEPNNSGAGNQNVLWFGVAGVDANPPARVNQWDDFQPFYSGSRSYVIEYDAMPVPEPEQWGAMIGLGVACWAILRRRFGPRKDEVRPGKSLSMS